MTRHNWSHTCPTGKRTFHARADAKEAAKSHRREGDHVRPYECPDCGQWHLGHMPLAVLRGTVTAKEWYR